MKWTNELPTASGYYWWRSDGGYNGSMYAVFTYNGQWYSRYCGSILCERTLLTQHEPGQWYGPVTGPDEDSTELREAMRNLIEEVEKYMKLH